VKPHWPILEHVIPLWVLHAFVRQISETLSIRTGIKRVYLPVQLINSNALHGVPPSLAFTYHLLGLFEIKLPSSEEPAKNNVHETIAKSRPSYLQQHLLICPKGVSITNDALVRELLTKSGKNVIGMFFRGQSRSTGRHVSVTVGSEGTLAE
jgi:hypothetical protein